MRLAKVLSLDAQGGDVFSFGNHKSYGKASCCRDLTLSGIKMTRGDGMIENAMGFSEASAFKAIVSSYQIAQNNQLFPQMKVFWKSDVPSKVLFFSWRLFHDRLATREQLQNRGVLNLQQSGLCSWCQQSAETINHLFFLCPIANQVFFG